MAGTGGPGARCRERVTRTARTHGRNWCAISGRICAGSGPSPFDDADAGLSARWQEHPSFPQTITVPFPPESAASGIGDTGFHPVIWYHREITQEQLAEAGFRPGTRLMLRFGAVDYRCSVWLDGQLLGRHEGGHTPFGFDATDALGGAESHTLVVRAEDDPHDLSQPRGKQDWQLEPHDIWYRRTSGIWQPVWLEAVPDLSIEQLTWRPDAAAESCGCR